MVRFGFTGRARIDESMAEELDIRTYRAGGPVAAAEAETAGRPTATFIRTVLRSEDADLVERAREGDPEAFHLLYVRHAPSVRRFLGGVLRDAAAADDALQETFARAHRKLRSLRDPVRVRAWLLGMARIVALDEVGRERRTVLADLRETAEEDFDPLDTPEIGRASCRERV